MVINVTVVDKETGSTTKQLYLSCDEDPAAPSHSFCAIAQLNDPTNCDTLVRYARNRWESACWTQEQHQHNHTLPPASSGNSGMVTDDGDHNHHPHLTWSFAPFLEVSEGQSSKSGVFETPEDGSVIPDWEDPPDILSEMAANVTGEWVD